MNKCTDKELLQRLADLYRCFAEPTRLAILLYLSERSACVNDIAEAIALSPSAVSHQLRHLRQMRLVAVERQGRYAYYRLHDQHVQQLIVQGMEHIHE